MINNVRVNLKHSHRKLKPKESSLKRPRCFPINSAIIFLNRRKAFRTHIVRLTSFILILLLLVTSWEELTIVNQDKIVSSRAHGETTYHTLNNLLHQLATTVILGVIWKSISINYPFYHFTTILWRLNNWMFLILADNSFSIFFPSIQREHHSAWSLTEACFWVTCKMTYITFIHNTIEFRFCVSFKKKRPGIKPGL